MNLYQRVWYCQSCDSCFREQEWREFGSERVLPPCPACGEENWDQSGIRECPEGCLLIEEEA